MITNDASDRQFFEGSLPHIFVTSSCSTLSFYYFALQVKEASLVVEGALLVLVVPLVVAKT